MILPDARSLGPEWVTIPTLAKYYGINPDPMGKLLIEVGLRQITWNKKKTPTRTALDGGFAIAAESGDWSVHRWHSPKVIAYIDSLINPSKGTMMKYQTDAEILRIMVEEHEMNFHRDASYAALHSDGALTASPHDVEQATLYFIQRLIYDGVVKDIDVRRIAEGDLMIDPRTRK